MFRGERRYYGELHLEKRPRLSELWSAGHRVSAEDSTGQKKSIDANT
jgi:hypothetical protein